MTRATQQAGDQPGPGLDHGPVTSDANTPYLHPILNLVHLLGQEGDFGVVEMVPLATTFLVQHAAAAHVHQVGLVAVLSEIYLTASFYRKLAHDYFHKTRDCKNSQSYLNV